MPKPLRPFVAHSISMFLKLDLRLHRVPVAVCTSIDCDLCNVET